MSYAPTGLGYAFTIDIPGLGRKTVNIPIEQMVEAAVAHAVAAMTPALEQMADQAARSLLPLIEAEAEKLWGIYKPRALVEVNKVVDDVEQKAKKTLLYAGGAVAALALIGVLVATAKKRTA